MKLGHLGRIAFFLTFLVTLPFLPRHQQASLRSSTTVEEKNWTYVNENTTNSSTTTTPTILHSSWHGLKQALCPDMVPNNTFSDIIFALAAMELDMVDAVTTPQERLRRPALVFDFLSSLNNWIDTSNNRTISYVAVYKAANNQINAFTNWVYENQLKKDNDDRNSQHHWKHERWAFHGMEHVAPDVLVDRLVPSNTCLVAAVRDPASRFLSGYNEIEYRLSLNYHKATTHAWNFTEVPVGSSRRVEAFVRDLITWYFHCPDREHAEFCQAPGVEVMHLWGMSGVLSMLHEYGRHKLSGYLPGIADLNERWPRFVADTCFDGEAAPYPDHTTMPVMGQHGSSQDPHGTYAAAKRAWHARGAVAKAVCALNVMDYACFDFDDGIPELCQRVFAQPHFEEALTSSS